MATNGFILQSMMIVFTCTCLAFVSCNSDEAHSYIDCPSEWPSWLTLPGDALPIRINNIMKSGGKFSAVTDLSDSRVIEIGFSYYGRKEDLTTYILRQVEEEFSQVRFESHSTVDSSGQLFIGIFSQGAGTPSIEIKSFNYSNSNDMSDSHIQVIIPDKG